MQIKVSPRLSTVSQHIAGKLANLLTAGNLLRINYSTFVLLVKNLNIAAFLVVFTQYSDNTNRVSAQQYLCAVTV